MARWREILPGGEGRVAGWVPYAALVAAAIIVFLPVMCGGGFFWDDYQLLVNNHPVQSGLGGLRDIWFTTKNPDYFPLTSTLFWIEWHLWGTAGTAWIYHIVNVAIHAGSGVLLWRVLRRLRVPGAFLAALLWVVHPVNVESAAWIAEGKNTLSMLCLCGAVLLYLRAIQLRHPGEYGWAVFLFFLALLAKTAVVMLPVVLLILAWYRRGRLARVDVLRTLPFFGLSAALGVVTLWFQAHRSIAETVVRSDGFASRLATAGCAVWFYLGKALLPVGITFNYPRWDVLSHGAWAWVPLAGLAALFAALWALRRGAARAAAGGLGRRPAVSTRGWSRAVLAALAIYVVMLLPTLGFVNVFFMRYAFVSDHWQYHALPAICALAAAGATLVVRRVNVSVAQAWLAVVGIAVAALMGEAFSVALVYRSARSVWEDTLAHNHDSWLAEGHLGALDLDEARANHSRAQLTSAMEHLRRVVDLRPQETVGYVNLGNALLVAGRPDDALKMYRKGVDALVGSPGDRGLGWINIGNLLEREGKVKDALAAYVSGTVANPRSELSYDHVGRLKLKMGDVAGAKAALEKSAELDPTFAEPRVVLAGIALRAGDRAGALAWLKAAAEAEPQNADVRRAIADVSSRAATPSSAPATHAATLPATQATHP